MEIEIYKFGGASIADSERIKNVAKIIGGCTTQNIVTVVSAMGKTTNALETVWNNRTNISLRSELMENITLIHLEVARELCPDDSDLQNKIKSFSDLDGVENSGDEDMLYDRIVSIGELMSSSIVAHYLRSLGHKVAWLDARSVIKTNNTYRDGKVNWEISNEKIKNKADELFESSDIIVSQGFIASTEEDITVTLGREGSDYTAAIFAYCLDAECVTIWKDVKGILTGDPRRFENVVKMDRLSYTESIEMTYYGAKVIHPKTIKPLQNKQIPLYTRSFIDPLEPGTLISSEIELTYPPIVVVETNQALIHFSTKDFSFIAEEHLAELFATLNSNRIKVNMMKNTAISFTICVTNSSDRIKKLLKNLDEEYRIAVDRHLELITIRHATGQMIDELRKGKVVLMEERAKNTVQLVVKDAPLMVRI